MDVSEGDGEVGDVEMACSLADSSSELAATEVGDVDDVGVDLGQKGSAFSCQDEAQDNRETKGSKERAWRRSRRPELKLPVGGEWRTAGSTAGSPVAWRGEWWGRNGGEVVAFL